MRLFILSLFALLVMFQYDFWFGKNGYLDYQDIKVEIIQRKQENQKLSQRNQTIFAEIQDLKNGIEAIEERARMEHEMIKQNEVFYRIVKNKNR
ncbi:cell division protein FtsB [Histophilus somni]|uniref:cell division protein FtsB n=1 Tax=Histophilus somni TaxID=731 RepID=UPI00094B34A2|nr:cell division protein FtsB [Histophilus somni]